MIAGERQPVGAPEHTMMFTVPDALYQELLNLCESRGWSADAGLCIAVAHGVRFLQDRDDASDEQIALLCAENARLRDWIEQCQTGRASGIATMDSPSPAWLWRQWPWVRH